MAHELHTADPQLDSLLRHVAGAEVSEPSMPVAAPLPAGARLGPFELLEVAGQGGMGVVYRARDERLQREVAVKVLPAGGGGDGQARLLAEARAAAAASHPNIASVYEAGVADGRAYFVMELVRGTSLQQLIDAGQGSRSQRLAWAADLARALAHLHGRGWLHLDVKPSNVMLGDDGTLKLLDLGVARPAVSEADGIVRGTVGYMAPEQARGAAVDARADVYSFGVLLRALFPSAAPRGLKAIIERCVAPEASLRFASGAELVTALSGLGRRRPLVAVLAVLLFVAVVAAVARLTFAVQPAAVSTPAPTRRLTGHRLDAPINAAALSADGAHFAYVDDDGLALADRAQPQRVRRVPLPRVPSWVGRLSRAGDWVLITHGPGDGDSTLWRVDDAGRSSVLYEGRFRFAALRPGGANIAVTDRERLVVKRLPGGEDEWSVPVVPFEWFGGGTWSPDGKLLAVSSVRATGQGSERVLSVWSAGSHERTFELKSPRLQQPYAPVVWSFADDGSLLYAFTERPGEGTGAAVWSQRLDENGRPSGAPVRLASLDGQYLASVDLSNDGQLLTLRHDVRARVLTAGLADGALGAVTTLTEDQFDERNTAWASAQTLWHVSVHDLVPSLWQGGAAVAAVKGWAQTAPTATSTPGTVLYWAAQGERFAELPEWRLMLSRDAAMTEVLTPSQPREPLGAAAIPPTSAQVRCAAKVEVCLLAAIDKGVVTFWRLSLDGGAPEPLFRLPEVDGYFRAWQVGTNGDRVIAATMSGPLVSYDLAGKKLSERRVPELDFVRYLALAGDDEHFFLAGLQDEGEHRIVYVSPDAARVVRAHEAVIYSDLAVSPDGSRLAFVEQTFDTDVWVTPLGR